MNRREFLASGAAFAQAQKPRRKPNLVFILADDLGCFDLGCYGQKLIETPNIDKIAAEGLRFTQAYAGGAVCAPSRCTLMTGMHLGHATIRDNHSRRNGGRVPLRAEDVTVAEILKKAGYATGIFGKWGLGEPGTAGVPNRQGFDDWFGFLNQDHAIEYFTDHLWRNETKETLRGNLNGGRREYTTELFTREALRFIRAHRNDPFFLYLPYTAPHTDIDAPSDLQYASKPWPPEARTIAAMTGYMDRGVGQVMSLLRELRLEQDTLVMFASDNGAGHKKYISAVPQYGQSAWSQGRDLRRRNPRAAHRALAGPDRAGHRDARAGGVLGLSADGLRSRGSGGAGRHRRCIVYAHAAWSQAARSRSPLLGTPFQEPFRSSGPHGQVEGGASGNRCAGRSLRPRFG